MRLPSAQAQPTSTSEMRRDCPGQRNIPQEGLCRSRSLRSTVLQGDVAIQMTVDDCIAISERECLDAPCSMVVHCDYAGQCLALNDDLPF